MATKMIQNNFISGYLRLISAVLCFSLLVGCPKPESNATKEKEPVKRPLEGVKLSLAVVDDPALAAAIVRLRGEWNAQTGAELQVTETTEKDLASADALPTDAVLCPSHLLGVLAERDQLVPLPVRIQRTAQWGGLFELLKLREAAWGTEVFGVPFGSPVLTCYYRAELLEKKFADAMRKAKDAPEGKPLREFDLD